MACVSTKINAQALILGIISMQIIVCVSSARNLQEEALHQPLKEVSVLYSSPPTMMSTGEVQLSSSMNSTGDVQEKVAVGKYPDTTPGNSNPIGHHEISPEKKGV